MRGWFTDRLALISVVTATIPLTQRVVGRRVGGFEDAQVRPTSVLASHTKSAIDRSLSHNYE